MAATMAPLYSLGDENQNEVQHKLFDYVTVGSSIGIT